MSVELEEQFENNIILWLSVSWKPVPARFTVHWKAVTVTWF